jgi:hypothetical protein
MRRGVASDHLWHLADLPARDLDAGRLGAGAQADRDLAQHLLARLLDGDVVE